VKPEKIKTGNFDLNWSNKKPMIADLLGEAKVVVIIKESILPQQEFQLIYERPE